MVGGQNHAPAALPPGKRSGTHCTEGLVGPRAGLDGCGKSRSHWESIPGSSSPQPVAIPNELSQSTVWNNGINYLYYYNVNRLSSNLGASTSWNTQGLSRPLMGLLLRVQCKCVAKRRGGSAIRTVTETVG
jgi:hypothetical protein